MPSLRELQQLSYRAIVLEEDVPIPSSLRDARRGKARLGVYRNNARETFVKTLAVTYPVVMRLVGEPCFRSLARFYMRDFPSRSGNLERYGAELPTLLDIYYRDTSFAYLADVARLEWACAEADTAADSRPLDWLGLADAGDDAHPDLRFRLRGPVRLVSSLFPVLTIFQANQADEVRPVSLSAGAEHVLVTRAANGVVLYGLDVGTFAFTRSLADGESLADACAAGEAASAEFFPDAALKTLAGLEVLAAVRWPAETMD